MGLRERFQTVTRFFQKAATRGHQLREEDARDEGAASSAGKQTRQREERPQGGMTAEDQPSQQRDRDRQGQSGVAKTPTGE